MLIFHMSDTNFTCPGQSTISIPEQVVEFRGNPVLTLPTLDAIFESESSAGSYNRYVYHYKYNILFQIQDRTAV